jgi:hypothetical protein
MPRETCPRDASGALIRFGDLVRAGERLLLVVDLAPATPHVVRCAWTSHGVVVEAELCAAALYLVRPALFPRPAPEP